MNENILNAFKELEKIQNNMKRMNEYVHNKKIGYEPKCKICNSKYQDVIERSRERGHTLEDMREYLKSKGENVSLMSLSRHFDRHYPARKRYLSELNDEKIRAIEKGEKEIDRILKHHPEIIEILEGDITIDYDYDEENDRWKEINKPAREVFIFDYGYCFDGDKLCKLVPKAKLLSGMEVSDELEIKLRDLIEGRESDYLDKEKFKVILDLMECVKCQSFYTHCTIEALLNIVVSDKYGITIEKDKFNRIAFKEEFIPKDIDKELQKIASRERAKVQKHHKK